MNSEMARWFAPGATIRRLVVIGKKNIFQLPPRVLSEEGEQKHDANARLTNDHSKKMLVLAPMVILLLPLLLVARRDPAQRRT